MKFLSCLAFAFIFALSSRAAEEKAAAPIWEQALVTIEVTRKQYDYFQPWTKSVGQAQKMGIIIGDKEILTTADYMADRTLIRLQKNGRGRWHKGELKWIDYHANLAIVSCDEDNFWKDTRAAQVADVTPIRGTAQIVRWRNGILESRNSDINRMLVKKGKLTFIDLPFLEVDSEMTGLGWSEAIVIENKLIGIASSKEEHSATVIPSFFIAECLKDRKNSPYNGLGWFSFVWQPAENPATLAYLGEEGEPRGVIVTEVNTNKLKSPFQSHDIILNIDGFDIDVQGDYKDPDYGNVLLENLATRKKRAGDSVKIHIIRDRKEMDISYKLPRADYNLEIVPSSVPDQEPEYLLLGGLLFEPLTAPYLASWGSDWSRKAPFRLSYATKEDPKPDQKAFVILSMVLPDSYNVGYQEARYLIVESFNGEKVQTLQQVLDALKKPSNGFHIVEFREGDSLRRIVLDADTLEAATKRVLQRYGIQSDRFIVSKAVSPASPLR